MKQFNISGSLVKDEEKEQASESNGGKPDFKFKAKFVLTMLNVTIYKHTWCRKAVPDGYAGQQSNESLKGCYASYFSKTSLHSI